MFGRASRIDGERAAVDVPGIPETAQARRYSPRKSKCCDRLRVARTFSHVERIVKGII